MKKILAFAGSNSSKSINKILVHCAANLIKNHKVTVIDLRDYEAPIFSPDIEESDGFPQSMQDLSKLLKEYDGFIMSAPEYNSSITPVLKNTLDWLSRIDRPVFGDKPMLLMSTSDGKRGGRTILHYLEGIIHRWGAKIAATYSLPLFKYNMDTATATLTNEDEKAKLQAAVEAFEDTLG